MSLTTAQLQTLKTAIMAETDSTFVGYRTNGQTGAMTEWLNSPSAFIVRRTKVRAAEIGPVLNYVAVSNLNNANRDRATTFLSLNQVDFVPTADVEAYWDTTFSGALGGQGQATRDALAALWRRFATRAERVFATGTGTSASPGTLGWEGMLSEYDVVQATTQV